jgi:hypothetical protein
LSETSELDNTRADDAEHGRAPAAVAALVGGVVVVASAAAAACAAGIIEILLELAYAAAAPRPFSGRTEEEDAAETVRIVVVEEPPHRRFPLLLSSPKLATRPNFWGVGDGHSNSAPSLHHDFLDLKEAAPWHWGTDRGTDS